jgi:hypothetical protein
MLGISSEEPVISTEFFNWIGSNSMYSPLQGSVYTTKASKKTTKDP